MNSFGIEARKLGVAPTLQAQFPILRQTALNLLGVTTGSPSSIVRSSETNRKERRTSSCLVGVAMDQDTLLSEVEGKGQSMTFRDICTFRLMLAYIYGDLNTMANMIETLSEFPVDNPMVVRVLFRRAFTALAAYSLSRKSKTRKTRYKFRKIANREFNYFKQTAKKGSVNACPVYALLLAERYPSKQRYDEAIRICCRSGFKNFEAIAFECCGSWLSEKNKRHNNIDDHYWASVYLSQSVQRYLEWEAIGKAEQLREKYSTILMDSDSTTSSTIENNNMSSVFGTSFRGKKVHQDDVVAKMKALHLDDMAILSPSKNVNAA